MGDERHFCSFIQDLIRVALPQSGAGGMRGEKDIENQLCVSVWQDESNAVFSHLGFKSCLCRR